MERDEEPRSHLPQCPVGSSKGRRNMKVNSEESSSERVELMVALKISKPKMSLKVSSCFCVDSEACGCNNGLFDSPSSRRLSPGTAAAQTQMPSTKPKARTLVACRQLIDVNEAASLRDRFMSGPGEAQRRTRREEPEREPPLQELTFIGTVTSVSTDSKRTSSVHESITGEASVSAAQRDEAPKLNLQTSNITREENKREYHKELRLQIEEGKQQREREKRRNNIDEQKHNETMQHSIWGMPGSGAPNYHRATVKRTNSLYSAGILPQEQIRDKGFSGTPFHCL